MLVIIDCLWNFNVTFRKLLWELCKICLIKIKASLIYTLFTVPFVRFQFPMFENKTRSTVRYRLSLFLLKKEVNNKKIISDGEIYIYYSLIINKI